MAGDSFLTRVIQARISRPLSDFIAYYIVNLNPQELESSLAVGWSLVAQLKERPREELLAVLDTILVKYPDIKRQVDKSRNSGASSMKSSGLELISGIDIDRLIVLVSNKLPAHGAVLARHRDWLENELKLVSELLV